MDPADGLDHLVHILDDESGDAVVDDFGDRSVAERDDRCARGHGLDHDQPEGFRPEDGEEESGGVGEQLAPPRVADFAEKDDLVVQLGLDDVVEVVGILRLQRAGHDQATAGTACHLYGQVEAFRLANTAEGQQVVVLLLLQRPHAEVDGIGHHPSPVHAGRTHGALVLADGVVGDRPPELVVETGGDLVEGRVDGVQHRRQRQQC